MAGLVLGPLLRHAGATDATIWVQADAPCEVEVRGATERTFELEGHHFALVHVTGLPEAAETPYEVRLDGATAWPRPDDPWPAPRIRTIAGDHGLRIAFGSCRLACPNEPPYTLTKDEDDRGREHDALRALALRMRDQPASEWPHLVLMLGDQVYADEVPPATAEFIRGRRDVSRPPGEEVADFEEYCRLYLDSWSEPAVRWLLSTVPTAMIFDDHDIHDDWNTSKDWVEAMRATDWWQERIVGGLMSYWAFQHLGNLDAGEREADGLYRRVRAAEGDAGALVREFVARADREVSGARWSYFRDIGRTRMVMMDSRAGRVLEPRGRSMVDAEEWACIEEWTRGEFDHLLLGTSLPVALGAGMQHLEAWNEAVCDGAWGRWAARRAERMRQALDLEHWAAFGNSVRLLEDLLERVASGRHGRAPGSVVLLSGDVHHAYVARADFADRPGCAPVHQVVCSPMRNPLDRNERRAIRLGMTHPVAALGALLARAAGVPRDPLAWTLCDGPLFDNQIGTLDIDGRRGLVRIEKATAPGGGDPRLHAVLERRLA